MGTFSGLDHEEARAFADRWLPAWTGNDPERLLAFYTEDAFYSDPAVPGGIEGRVELRAYFTKLLGRNPDWVWAHKKSTPMRDGFVNFWRAAVPVRGMAALEIDGVCLVQLQEGLIRRNEVFFDRAELLRALAR